MAKRKSTTLKAKSTRRAKPADSTADVIATLQHLNKQLDPVVKLAEQAKSKAADWRDMEAPLRDIHGLAAGIELIALEIPLQYESSAVLAVGAALFEKAKLLRHIFYLACGDSKHAAEYLPREGAAS